MNVSLDVRTFGGLVLALVGLRGIVQREITLYYWSGLRLKDKRQVEGRPAVLFGIWLIIVGVLCATAPWWWSQVIDGRTS
jgi:hypothetical protein